jgi:excisionase family DNA binding protein
MACWVTVRYTAEMLRVTPRTIRNWIDNGWIPAQQVGPKLFRLRDVDVFTLVLVVRPLQDKMLNRNLIHSTLKNIRWPSMVHLSGK